MDTTLNTIELPTLDSDTTKNKSMQFRVSAGLKRVLGRELITNDDVAIFELVKNSFDANAKEVYLHFDDEAITIADDGVGMSFGDLRDKWLFVAYSSKRNVNRLGGNDGFRDQVADRRQYAGSKGIGRFSSDRLGRLLVLQTRSMNDPMGPVHCLEVDWDKFEEDDSRQFGRVDVSYREASKFDLPDGVPDREYGTVIHISKLIKPWTREELLKLRSGLAKLINPFGATTDGFGITILAKNELATDVAIVEKAKRKSSDNQDQNVPVVNGQIGNFIFGTLQEKTTFIDVQIDPLRNTIETILTDRGEVIYHVREKNVKYPLLQNAGFRCQLYSLNRAAKATFARRMGLPAVQFGSVFLFRNGFRVFPIGEQGDDWFLIDRRKQQGQARYLGTRDIIGRIDVSGSESMFQEASSRNQGLIETSAAKELRMCFREQCLKRLERYVVSVSWGTQDIDFDTLAYVETDKGRTRVAAVVASIIGSEDVEVLQYSQRLIDTLNERSEQFETSLVNLRVIANSTKDRELSERIEEAEKRFVELKRSEAEARRIADEERRAKEQAEERADSAVTEAHIAKEQLGEERKRNLFLASITSLDVDTILNMHHSITIYASDLQKQVENFMSKINDLAVVQTDIVVNRLESIALLNKKVLAVARFATKANFRLQSEYIEEDLAHFIVSYIEDVATNFLDGRTSVHVKTDGKAFNRTFKPIDVSIVVDNLISNATKARATKIEFDLKQPRKGLLEVYVSDDGKGISPEIIPDDHLFEKGITTTDGSGLGLYHVRQVLGDLDGTIQIVQGNGSGATFLMRIPV